jgi:hypothetical protein
MSSSSVSFTHIIVLYIHEYIYKKYKTLILSSITPTYDRLGAEAP